MANHMFNATPAERLQQVQQQVTTIFPLQISAGCGPVETTSRQTQNRKFVLILIITETENPISLCINELGLSITPISRTLHSLLD